MIDTTSTFSLDLFKQYNTVALLTNTDLVYENKGILNIESLDQVPDGVLTKTKLATVMAKVDSYLRIIPAIVVIFIFIGLVLFGAFELLYLVFAALVIWLILKILKLKGGYRFSYHIGLHAITLGLLVSTVYAFFSLPSVPFLFSLILILVVLTNLRGMQKPEVSAS